MTETKIDLATWPRRAQFALFRNFQKPHYAITSRIDMSHVMARKSEGLSPYRASLYAIGCGVHRTEAFCLRFRGMDVVQHDLIDLSMTVQRPVGGFGLGYLPFTEDFATFDTAAKAEIERVQTEDAFEPDKDGQDNVAYLSCLPWLDYTSLDNALPSPEDCIPRIGWGKIVDHGAAGFDMAMTVQAHHALVDGADVAAFFATVEDTLNRL